jgi:hypothetical protein
VKRNQPESLAQPRSIELEKRLCSLLDEVREVRKALRLVRSLERADAARDSRQEVTCV